MSIVYVRGEPVDSVQWNNFQLFRQLATQIAQAAIPVWHMGDGYGGTVRQMIETAFLEAGLENEPQSTDQTPKRKPIPHEIRRAVYERDKYRCVTCGTHLDLSLDHIVAWSKGGQDDADNLQTLCRSCNSRKRDR